jgi:hypothetical protein
VVALVIGCTHHVQPEKAGGTAVGPAIASATAAPQVAQSPAADLGATALRVTKKGVWPSSDGQLANYAFIVEDTDNANAVTGARYVVRLLDPSGAEVGRDSNGLGVVLPDRASAIADVTALHGQPVSIEVTLYGGTAEPKDNFRPIALAPATFDAGTVTGNVTNPYDADLLGESVVAVLYDSTGNMIGGYLGTANLPGSAQSSVVLHLTVYSPEAVASAVLYPAEARTPQR